MSLRSCQPNKASSMVVPSRNPTTTRFAHATSACRESEPDRSYSKSTRSTASATPAVGPYVCGLASGTRTTRPWTPSPFPPISAGRTRGRTPTRRGTRRAARAARPRRQAPRRRTGRQRRLTTRTTLLCARAVAPAAVVADVPAAPGWSLASTFLAAAARPDPFVGQARAARHGAAVAAGQDRRGARARSY